MPASSQDQASRKGDGESSPHDFEADDENIATTSDSMNMIEKNYEKSNEDSVSQEFSESRTADEETQRMESIK